MTSTQHSPRIADKRPLLILVALLSAMLVISVAVRMLTQVESSTPNTQAEVAGKTLTEWQAGVERTIAIENDIFANPDPSRVGEIMTENCTCYAPTVQRLQNLKNANRHVEGANLKLESVTLNQQISENEVKAFVVISDNQRPTVDSQGSVVSRSPQANRAGFIYTIIRGEDNIWRIADRASLAKAQVENSDEK